MLVHVSCNIGEILLVAYSLSNVVPRTTFLLFFVIPMPAIAVVLGVAGYDFYQAFTLKVRNIKHHIMRMLIGSFIE